MQQSVIQSANRGNLGAVYKIVHSRSFSSLYCCISRGDGNKVVVGAMAVVREGGRSGYTKSMLLVLGTWHVLLLPRASGFLSSVLPCLSSSR